MPTETDTTAPLLDSDICYGWIYAFSNRRTLPASVAKALGFSLSLGGPPTMSALVDVVARDAFSMRQGAVENGNTLLHLMALRPPDVKTEQAHELFLSSMALLSPLLTHQVNALNKGGRTPLQTASFRGGPGGNPLMVHALLAAGASIDLPDGLGDTPLHDAAYVGLYEIVALLLRAGANPTVLNRSGLTPLDIAKSRGSLSVIPLLNAHLDYFSLCDSVPCSENIARPPLRI